MFLKQVELYGFKSFAGKTVLKFGEGITAIVGPNGCGKCLHGDSKVYLASGQQIPIQDIVEQSLQFSSATQELDDGFVALDNPFGFKVLSLNTVNYRIEERPIESFIKRRAPRFLLKIVTKSGREITTTHYHPFFTLENGHLKQLKAEELKEGVYISLPRRIPSPSRAQNPRINLDEIADFFSPEDHVYLPYSEELEKGLKEISAQKRSQASFERSYAVPAKTLSGVFAKQAMNVAHYAKLQYPLRKHLLPKSELKSKNTVKVKLPTEMLPALGKFLGYVISEGRVTSANHVRFVNSDPKVVKDFCALSQELFGVQAKVLEYQQGTKDVLIFSSVLCQYLNRVFGLQIDQHSSKKKVPSLIFESDDHVIRAFLSTLFEGDGYINDKYGYVEYTSASEQLIHDVAALLLRFGIYGVIRRRMKCAVNTVEKKKRPYWSCYIYGAENLHKAKEIFSFLGPKSERLQGIKITHNPNPNKDFIPGIQTVLKELIRATGIPIKKNRRLCPRLGAYYENCCEATRTGVRIVLQFLKEKGHRKTELEESFTHLESLANSDVYWDPIRSIEKVVSPEWVYDLCIVGDHNFIAEGLIVHNSNIQESIKWVLGEQNPRELRGKEMQDIIFNGTADVPSLGFAEVSLTLDNSTKFFSLQYDEVVITRRLYRSGESEYLINKVPVRLKDIADLIAGTGMGTSAYSIIEQGKMDQVLAAKPEERRDIFEEASGITKYKIKEKEALRKLEQTEENLIRVRDILLEVKRQVGSIERQAAKAQKYQQFYEQLKKLEIGLGALDYRQFGRRKLQAEQKKLELETSIQQSSQEGNRYSEKTASLKQELAGRRQVLEEKEKEWAQLEASFRLSQDRVAMEKQTQKEWQSQKERLSGELSAAAGRIEQLNGQIRQGEQDQEAIKRERKIKEEKLLLLEKEIQSLLDSIRSQEESASLGQSRLADLMKRQVDLNNELLQAVHQRQNLAGQQARLSKQREEVSEELFRLEEEKTGLLRSEQEYRGQLEELGSRATRIFEKLSAFRAACQQTTEQLHQKENLQSALAAKIQFLEDLRIRYEGFSEGVRYLLAGEKPLVEGVFDCVANLIEVEAGYESAVEAALGEHLQTVLVDNTPTALKAMEATAGFGKGKVTLLSLEWIPYSASGGAQENPAKGKQLLQFVRCDERYRPAIEYLLKDIFVLEELNAADLTDIELSTVRFVTRDGRLLGNGFISGGKVGTQDSTLIGREGRIRQLKAEEQEITQQIETLKNHLVQTKETISSLEAEQVEVHRKNQELEKELAQRQAGGAELGRRTQSLISQKDILEKEVSALVSERRILEEKETELNRLAAETQVVHQKERQQLESLRQSVSAGEQERENRQIHLTEIKTELNALVREAEKQERTMEFLRQTLANEEESQAGRQKSLGELEKRIEQSQEIVLKLEEQAQIWGDQRENFQKELSLLKSRQMEIEAELTAAEAEERALQEKKQQIQEAIHLVQMEIKEMEVKIEHLLLRLSDAYQVEAAALETTQLECEMEQAQTELQQLRQKVQQMGPVNVAALEEHKELTERLQFLTTQEQDLADSKESLTSAIQKIRRTTRGLFRETFEKIQTNFHHYFTKLFGGGDAQLVLMDQEEVLESGIEIMVRPPGKKLQNISLLSGGEKALTATALLFALFKTKPSPFCILDEIDAPLDEANIDRFCDALKEFTQQSQFLIITHNKKTMTIADVLYGVTMERAGISQIISVKLARSAETTAPVSLEEAEPATA